MVPTEDWELDKKQMLNRDAPPSVSHSKCLHAFTASTFNNMETITVIYITYNET